MIETSDTIKAITQTKEIPNSEKLLSIILRLLEERKAVDIRTINLREKSIIGDFMVLASGQSSRQVITMSNHVMRGLKNYGISGAKPEGAKNGDWILIDAGDIILHLFRPEVREFYNLEKIWEAYLASPDEGGNLLK